MSHLRNRSLLGLLACALVVPACGKTSSNAAVTTITVAPTTIAATTTTAAPTTTEPATTTEPPTTSSPTRPSVPDSVIARLERIAEAALLVPSDIGSDFSDADYEPDNSTGPCSADDPDELVPASVKKGAQFDHNTLAVSLGEDIRIYFDEPESSGAFDIFRDLLDCTDGAFEFDDGSSAEVTLGVEIDLAGLNSNISEGFVKEIGGDEFKGSIAVVRLGASVITLTFASDAEEDTSTLPSPADVVDAAVTKAAEA